MPPNIRWMYVSPCQCHIVDLMRNKYVKEWNVVITYHDNRRSFNEYCQTRSYSMVSAYLSARSRSLRW